MAACLRVQVDCCSLRDGQTVYVEPRVLSEGLELCGGIHTVVKEKAVVTVEHKNVKSCLLESRLG